MRATEEKSPGGSDIYRYGAAERQWVAPAPPSKGVEEIERHFAEHFGATSTVFHEIISEVVHLDVHVIRPTPDRNWWTLFTTGMSDRPMTVPTGAERFRYAELLIALPPDWRIDELVVTPAKDDQEHAYWR